jgi:hypothetical protein
MPAVPPQADWVRLEREVREHATEQCGTPGFFKSNAWLFDWSRKRMIDLVQPVRNRKHR